MILNRRFAWLALGGMLAALLSGCAAPSTPEPTLTPTLPNSTLPPYQTRTPTLAPTVPSETPLPSLTPTLEFTLTPTLRTYVVKAGDDMTGIAIRFRVKVADLKAANPTVTPNAMKIGTVLIIPGSSTLPTEAQVTPSLTLTPTTQPVRLDAPRCLPTAEGGATCFTLAHNQQDNAVENLTVAVRLLDASGKQIARQQATTPLDLLPAGTSLPVMTTFAPPLPAGYTPSAALVSYLPASEGAKRYIPVSVQGQSVNILPGGLSAEASGTVASTGDKPASQVWVVAIAYDAAGEVVGLRRWESSQALPAGGSAPFSLRVYTAGDPIARLDLLAQAKP